ncbi:hypothetical protein ABZ570_30810 [Micromonospora sp. NPDC007271]|uniref:hypothetical protein n=1 Tax=Micromonospora sp. NPDC007271 TaxID=3154587 RepID=UPI0033FA3113
MAGGGARTRRMGAGRRSAARDGEDPLELLLTMADVHRAWLDELADATPDGYTLETRGARDADDALRLALVATRGGAMSPVVVTSPGSRPDRARLACTAAPADVDVRLVAAAVRLLHDVHPEVTHVEAVVTAHHSALAHLGFHKTPDPYDRSDVPLRRERTHREPRSDGP